MTQDDRTFLTAIQAAPTDETLCLVYADWLEERGDCRGDFLRLQVLLRSLDPDHLQRRGAEQRISQLRSKIDTEWLTLIEPERIRHARQSCICMDAWHKEPPFPESQFHAEAQDTECDVWKRLLDLIEGIAARDETDFEPRQAAKDEHE
jgi:uncharacterized protein (TIGR02996 family)